MAKVRRVPWKNRSEWLEVYGMLHNSNDLAEIEKAAQHMELWIERGHCPPAVEYTCRFIQPICRDSYFFPSQSNAESETNLQVQYATAILRFINILGEVESEKSLSLNARALKIGLPEWVVNTRHQISHGSCLPSLDLLRISVDSLLKWLKINYWEVEKQAMKDIILPDSVFIFKDKLWQLLDIYVHLHKEMSKNTKFVGEINNQDVREKLMKLGKLQYQFFVKETRTWETIAVPSVSRLYESTQLLSNTILLTMQLVVRTIKPYFEHETDNATEVLVEFLLKDGVDENIGVEIKRWRLLLVALHAKDKFPHLLNRMVDYTCNKRSDYHKHATEWTVILLKSLLKRYKAQKKFDLISSNSLPSSKRVKLHLTEKQKTLLTKETVKHQLSVETGTHESNNVLPKLFDVIERKHPHLREALRLPLAKFLSEQEIHQLVHKIYLAPNKSTWAISELLLNMSTQLTRSAVVSLFNLAKLKSNTIKTFPKIYPRLLEGGTVHMAFNLKNKELPNIYSGM
ncbi:hypothetical protein GE061_001516 [Apolygus lucorum]|uniref:Ribosomal biogenesis protein LAS1L n=1 Tax=Apolygus lucorum TaxID=248454 RepID=A0A8S9Y7A4_APOLU|nr:hypothetical protein GE061_001516 [Apolygus lucorum]